MVAGMEFGWATNTTFLNVTPPDSIPWGQNINMEASVASLNPYLLNVTDGAVKFFLNGFLMQNVNVIGEATSLQTALHYKSSCERQDAIFLASGIECPADIVRT